MHPTEADIIRERIQLVAATDTIGRIESVLEGYPTRASREAGGGGALYDIESILTGDAHVCPPIPPVGLPDVLRKRDAYCQTERERRAFAEGLMAAASMLQDQARDCVSPGPRGKPPSGELIRFSVCLKGIANRVIEVWKATITPVDSHHQAP